MKFFIPTCDKYIYLVECLKITIEEFLPNNGEFEFHIIGYKNPKWDLGNWSFHCLGEDKGPQYFTRDLEKFFSTVEDDVFGYLNDDTLITHPLNYTLLISLINEIKSDEKIGRICLTDDGTYRRTVDTKDIGYNIIKNINGSDIIEYKQNSDYRISTQFSIWRRNYLLKYLDSDYNPWDFEVLQSQKSINDGYRILASNNDFTIPSFSHLMVRGLLNSSWHVDIRNRHQLSGEIKEKIKNKL